MVYLCIGHKSSCCSIPFIAGYNIYPIHFMFIKALAILLYWHTDPRP